MKFSFSNGINFNKLVVNIAKFDTIVDLFESRDRSMHFSLHIDGEEFSEEGIRGDDAIWLPYSSERGLKVIRQNEKYNSLDESLENIQYIRGCHSKAFPEIYWCEKCFCKNGNEYLLCLIENVRSTTKSKLSNKEKLYLPQQDLEFIEAVLENNQADISQVTEEFANLRLLPEDEWYKSINFINGKIVDFHRFEKMDERYKLVSPSKDIADITEIYNNIVSRYTSVLDSNGTPKWKGRIYQGFVFDNGAQMPGYTSDNKVYDSYRKLPFVPLNKVKGKNVLDLGSNQGFFSFQSAIHGAKSVTGVEIQAEDVMAANDIKNILETENVNFIKGDAINYLLSSEEHYGLIIANSVLHQIYPNLDDSDEVLGKISKCSEYFSFETPMNHPKMRVSMPDLYSKLSKHFKIVRLLNVYNAYSSGYRANFVCYS